MRASHAKIVQCHGVFDVLHAGHLAHFKAAKLENHTLIVTITADKFVNKGPGRPHFSQDIRAQMLAALEIVDYVCINESPTAVPAIRTLQPDIYAKGHDYARAEGDITGGIPAECEALGSNGVIIFTDETVHSSSAIINRYFSKLSLEQQQTIDLVKQAGGIKKILKIIDDLSRLCIAVTGEPIIDVYNFVKPEGVSSKYGCLSTRQLRTEMSNGGTVAIMEHVRDFVLSVKYFLPFNFMPIKKTRFMTDLGQRLFEIVEMENEPRVPLSFCDQLFNLDQDLLIVSDFGHGFFTPSLRTAIQESKTDFSLMVQTNSSNFGFNVWHKYYDFSYLCLDERELRIGSQDNQSSWQDLYTRTLGPYKISLTRGPFGSIYETIECPAFSDKPIDTTGAGDAYFALTSLLQHIDCDPVFVPFLGNVFAGLKTQIVANSAPVHKAALIKAVETLLK